MTQQSNRPMPDWIVERLIFYPIASIGPIVSLILETEQRSILGVTIAVFAVWAVVETMLHPR